MSETTTGPTLAIVGATGAVGTVMRDVLPMRRHLWGEVRLAAGAEDVGVICRVAGEDLKVEALTPEFFDGVDVAVVDIPPESGQIGGQQDGELGVPGR